MILGSLWWLLSFTSATLVHVEFTWMQATFIIGRQPMQVADMNETNGYIYVNDGYLFLTKGGVSHPLLRRLWLYFIFFFCQPLSLHHLHHFLPSSCSGRKILWWRIIKFTLSLYQWFQATTPGPQGFPNLHQMLSQKEQFSFIQNFVQLPNLNT